MNAAEVERVHAIFVGLLQISKRQQFGKGGLIPLDHLDYSAIQYQCGVSINSGQKEV
jgi:hypothetical protein